MTEDKKILQMPHQLILEDRRALTVSGVSDVDSFDELTVVCLLYTSYIVWEADGQAVVIDPGAQAGRILDEADAAGVRVRAVLLTHVHFDHILAAREIMNATGAELLVPAGDEPALTSPARSLLAMFLPGCRYDLQADRLLADGDTVTVGGLTLTVMHTPGHTPGSSCYICLLYTSRCV